MRRSSDGRLVLIDFGASKELSQTVQTKPGTTIGTYGYSPIEQIEDGEAYPASDLFALGTTCFHLLTGVSAFQLWTQQRYTWIPNWQQYLTSPISGELAKIIDKLLQLSRQERYQSADEVINDLRTPSKGKNNQRKNLLLAGAVTLVIGIGGGVYHWVSTPIPDKSSLIKTLSANSDFVSAVAISPDGKTLASSSYKNKPQTSVSDSRDTTIQLWDLATGNNTPEIIKGNDRRIYTIAISADSNTIAGGSSEKTIKLWNLSTKKEVSTLLGHNSAVNSITFSPDGQTLISGSSDGTIKLWNLSTGKDFKTIKAHSQEVKALAISSDGRILASGSADSTIKLWDIVSQQEITTLTEHSSLVNAVAISPDSKILASGSADKSIKLWSLPSGKEIRTLQRHSYGVNAVAFSPDGKLLASGSADSTIKLWNLPSGQESRTLKGHTKEVTSIAFSPDSQTLVSGSVDQTIKMWRVYP
jgi:WD40 repeat protein